MLDRPVLITLAALAGIIGFQPTAATAGQPSFFCLAASSGSKLELNSWQVKTAVLLVIIVCAFLIIFRGVYPLMLGRHTWPLTAYGRCWGLIVACAVIFGVILFWSDLDLSRGPDGLVRPGPPFLREMGLRIGIIVIWIIVEVLILITLRSPGAATARSERQ